MAVNKCPIFHNIFNVTIPTEWLTITGRGPDLSFQLNYKAEF